jgi:hypothetical protein
MRRSRLVALALAWLVTRALVVLLLWGRHGWVRGDLDYFTRQLAALPDQGLAHTLVEYPLPGVAVVAVPWLLVELLGAPQAYGEAVLALSLVADAVFMVLLARRARPRPSAALVVWLLAVPLLGATTYARFDLVPGVLAAAAVLLIADRPRVGACLGALATGLKLWPGLVLPALAVGVRARGRVLGVVAVTGALLVATTVVVAGPQRLVSPLTWQAERGLQIESVPATPVMVGWLVAPERYDVVFTEHNAFEVVGPGVTGLLAVSTGLTALTVAVLLSLWYLTWRHGGAVPAATVSWLALAAVSLVVVTSKVLSPQYLLWLLPLAAVAAGTSRGRAHLGWAAVLLAATAATQVVFPELYGQLTRRGEHVAWAVLALTVRNLALVALAGWALAAAVRGVSEAARSNASRGGRGGTSHAPAGAAPPTRT